MAYIKTQIWNFFKNGGLFLLLFGVTFYILLKDQNMSALLQTLFRVKLGYIFLGLVAMLLFVACEAVNIRRALKIFGYELRFLPCMKYAFVGFFFSSVTPSASGGQPMQVYYMRRDEVEVSHSSLALLMGLASYQTVTVLLALLGFCFQYHVLKQSIGAVRYLLMAGVGLNIFVLFFVLMAIFSKKISTTIGKFLAKIGFSRAQHQIEEYQNSAVFIKKNGLAVVKTFFTTMLQMLAMHSIPFWIYKAFGLEGYSFWAVLALQAVLYVMVSSLPLPGAVGVTETGFVLLFHSLFPAKLMTGAMLLSRGVSFYAFVLVSGLIVALIQFMPLSRAKRKALF